MSETEIKCPHCNNPDLFEGQRHCTNCGKLLHNFCLNPFCHASEELDPEYKLIKSTDVFCPLCGAETAFAEEGYVSTASL